MISAFGLSMLAPMLFFTDFLIGGPIVSIGVLANPPLMLDLFGMFGGML